MGFGLLLGAAPALLILAMGSNNIGRALISTEARLFYVMFGTFGATFGGGFYLMLARRLP